MIDSFHSKGPHRSQADGEERTLETCDFSYIELDATISCIQSLGKAFRTVSCKRDNETIQK
jgi:hypothetical protein